MGEGGSVGGVSVWSPGVAPGDCPDADAPVEVPLAPDPADCAVGGVWLVEVHAHASIVAVSVATNGRTARRRSLIQRV